MISRENKALNWQTHPAATQRDCIPQAEEVGWNSMGQNWPVCLSVFTPGGAEFCSLFICLYTGWGRILQFVCFYTGTGWGRILQFVYLSLHRVGYNSAVCLYVFTLGQAEFCSLFICLYTGSGRILQFVYMSLHWVRQNSVACLSVNSVWDWVR